VSPWFPMLLLAYPVLETFFSIYRKVYLRGRSASEPDGLHIHMLIYKRLARIGVGSKDRKKMTRRNSIVAVYVWAGTAMFILPSLVVWSSTAWLLILAFVFSVTYVWLYFRLVRWRAPAWMIISPKTRQS
ncbi:MAG TPA: glycosyl transferase family 4, partial [Dehalococcoidia bacterium]|nr:glycosyl transferase family 4 [Dehalococcoidia bacterium]